MKQTIHKDISLERIIFFSDAVFAIAITILALEIRLPEETRDLTDFFPEMTPKIIAYVFGFLQIAVFWSAHHNLFKNLVGYDSTVIWLNFIFLMIIAFLPVPIAAIIKMGITSGSITFIYTCLALLGIAEWFLWRYMSDPKHNLLDGSFTLRARKAEERKIVYIIVLFLFGILLSFLNPYVSLIIGVIIPFIHKRIDKNSK